MASDDGAAARFEARRRRRIRIRIDDIEPQSKKMPKADRNAFQVAVTKQLAETKRAGFRGDVALKLDLATTGKTAPQAHTIAKNFLDLLGTRLADVDWSRRSLLYGDDRQIQALSVLCRHGEDRPGIRIEARRFADMIDDIELAKHAVQAIQTRAARHEDNRDLEWLETVRNLLRTEADQRRVLGAPLYEAYLQMARWYAQRALLRRSGVDITSVAGLYGLPRGVPSGLDASQWADRIGKSALRLQVGDLPIAAGGSSVFRQKVADEIAAFKAGWDWLLQPLVVAVGLEVIVRPNPQTPATVLHDLDNIVRDYLVPSIVPAFDTVSDHRWTIDFEALRARDPKFAASWGPNPTPPAATRSGVTRYEAWRLPPVDGEPGFVSVALISDVDAEPDLMGRMDDQIRRWQAGLKGGDRRRRRWRT